VKTAQLLDATYELDTPFLVLDADQAERNLRRQALLAAHAGVQWYPHCKSHKSIEIARLQLEQGAAGLTCQTLGEAETMLAADPERIVLPGPIVGPGKLERLVSLARRVEVTVAVDTAQVAAGMSAALAGAGLQAAVLIEVDTGFRRCGVDPADVIDLARAVGDMGGLRLEGVFTYEGHIYDRTGPAAEQAAASSYEVLAGVLADLRAADMPVRRVSVGASAGMRAAVVHDAPTEVRWGSALFGDMTQVDMGVMGVEDCALGIVATVVSVPHGRRFVIDAGSKTLSYTPAVGGAGFGAVLHGDRPRITRLADEHAMVDAPPGGLEVGSRVVILPNAHAACVDAHNHYQVVRDGALLPHPVLVDARGMTR
ncbi:alanine racemase, partial [Nonomuraea sp. RK-328]|nr:alanine racemase [Nonomuraea sp. RK-328]